MNILRGFRGIALCAAAFVIQTAPLVAKGASSPAPASQDQQAPPSAAQDSHDPAPSNAQIMEKLNALTQSINESRASTPILAGMSPDDARSGADEAPGDGKHRITSIEFQLSLAILSFGLIVLCLQTLIILKTTKRWSPTATRMFGLTLIIISGVYLTTAGFSETQIAPMVGLLGTTVGFLLGRAPTPNGDGAAPPADNPAPASKAGAATDPSAT